MVKKEEEGRQEIIKRQWSSRRRRKWKRNGRIIVVKAGLGKKSGEKLKGCRKSDKVRSQW